jgi:hypothetical protein
VPGVSGRFVAGCLPGQEPAEWTINELTRSGLPGASISVVARDEVYQGAGAGDRGRSGATMPADQAARTAGLDRSSEPDMGSLLAVGRLGTLLAEATTAAEGHPLIAALRRLGLTDRDARRCADQVRAGAVLIVAEADPAELEEVRRPLRQAGAAELFEGRLAA